MSYPLAFELTGLPHFYRRPLFQRVYCLPNQLAVAGQVLLPFDGSLHGSHRLFRGNFRQLLGPGVIDPECFHNNRFDHRYFERCVNKWNFFVGLSGRQSRQVYYMFQAVYHMAKGSVLAVQSRHCLLYTSPSPRDS